MTRMPNFFIVGVQKAGTSSLHQYLAQHPQIHMSLIKEPRYFAFDAQECLDFPVPEGCDVQINQQMTNNSHDIRSDLAGYQRLFADTHAERWLGESSIWYLYSPGAAERIAQAVPDARMIAVLRQPVDRAYSAYLHTLREGIALPEPFQAALQLAETRSDPNWIVAWHLREMGRYAQQVARFQQYFDDRQLRVYIYEEDYQDREQAMVRDVCDFLEIDVDFEPEMAQQFNKSGLPTGRAQRTVFSVVQSVKRVLRPVKTALPQSWVNLALGVQDRLLTKVPLAPSLRQHLTDSLYRDDINKLESLLERDLSIWYDE